VSSLVRLSSADAELGQIRSYGAETRSSQPEGSNLLVHIRAVYGGPQILRPRGTASADPGQIL